MRTLHSISAIRHLIPLFIVSAALLSMSAMCDGGLLSEPDTPVTPVPKDPTPSEPTKVTAPVLTLEQAPAVFQNTKEFRLAFTVKTVKETFEMRVEKAEGCIAAISPLTENDEGYSGTVTVSVADSTDTVYAVLVAKNSAGEDWRSVTSARAKLTGLERCYEFDCKQQKKNITFRANFDGEYSMRVLEMDEAVNMYDFYENKWILRDPYEYDQKGEWLIPTLISKTSGNISLSLDTNEAICVWRKLPDRYATIEVTVTGGNGYVLSDTLRICQKGDDLSQFQKEIELYWQTHGFSSEQEWEDSGIGRPILLASKGHVVEWIPTYLQQEKWQEEGCTLDPRIADFPYLKSIRVNGSKQMTWPLPETFKKLKLKRLDLGGNNINGRLDDDVLKAIVENASAPFDLNLGIGSSHGEYGGEYVPNNFVGPIPAWIFDKCAKRNSKNKLVSYAIIGLKYNKLEGEIPLSYKLLIDEIHDNIEDVVEWSGCFPNQQEGYEVWLPGEMPEGYQYHESYYK